MKLLRRSVVPIALISAMAALWAQPQKAKFTGIITDSECAEGDHSHMRMGTTSAECTIACVEAHDASYVLYDGKQTWKLSDQKTPEKFAGKNVTVTGSLDSASKTIRALSIELSSPPASPHGQ